MSRLAAFTMLSTACFGAFAQPQPSPEPILPEAIAWQGPPNGAASAWIIGAADRDGIYAQRVKLAPGATIAPHTHPDERFSVVLQGTIYVGFGEVVEESKLVAVPQGAVYIAPAGVPHYVVAKDGEAIYQESGVGPTGANFLPQGQ